MAEYIVQQNYYPALFVERVVNAIIGIIELVLALRVILELFGANPGSEFVAWLYTLTAALIGPFTGAFAPLGLGNETVVDVVAILAMIAYAVLGWLISELLSFISVSTASGVS
jgi:hypothetical protein